MIKSWGECLTANAACLCKNHNHVWTGHTVNDDDREPLIDVECYEFELNIIALEKN